MIKRYIHHISKVQKSILGLLNITSFSLIRRPPIYLACICRKTAISGIDFPRLRRYSKHI
ncbi:hypothetical protein ApDm4_0756 [Acetobacter pomorum]|nr:hypothetical protein ApDm4_0756 [Acetobacter pomorum]